MTSESSPKVAGFFLLVEAHGSKSGFMLRALEEPNGAWSLKFLLWLPRPLWSEDALYSGGLLRRYVGRDIRKNFSAVQQQHKNVLYLAVAQIDVSDKQGSARSRPPSLAETHTHKDNVCFFIYLPLCPFFVLVLFCFRDSVRRHQSLHTLISLLWILSP